MESLSQSQTAAVEIADGRARASVRVTPLGLVAIGGLVTAILLATRALVATSIREGKR